MPVRDGATDGATLTEEPDWAAPLAPGPLDATVVLPGSKSLTNRYLVLAALASDRSRLRAPLRSRDTLLMAGALRALGVRIDDVQPEGESGSGGVGAVDSVLDWVVTPPETLSGDVTVDCGLAGTVMRFLPAVAALADRPVRLDGDPQARVRTMGPVIDALRALVAAVDDDEGHILMTVETLRDAGAIVDDSEPNTWRVEPSDINALDVSVEPDLSNAGPFVAAALVAGGTVRVPGWPQHTTQAGDMLREILDSMGADVRLDRTGLTVSGGDELAGIDIDLHDAAELTPTVAALAALASSPTWIRGVAHIRGHETDRLAALTAELGALGSRVTETEDGLRIAPAPLHGGRFRTYHDHRMATAGAIIGLRVPGVHVEDIGTTRKTLPDFVGLWQGMLDGSRPVVLTR